MEENNKNSLQKLQFPDWASKFFCGENRNLRATDFMSMVLSEVKDVKVSQSEVSTIVTGLNDEGAEFSFAVSKVKDEGKVPSYSILASFNRRRDHFGLNIMSFGTKHIARYSILNNYSSSTYQCVRGEDCFDENDDNSRRTYEVAVKSNGSCITFAQAKFFGMDGDKTIEEETSVRGNISGHLKCLLDGDISVANRLPFFRDTLISKFNEAEYAKNHEIFVDGKEANDSENERMIGQMLRQDYLMSFSQEEDLAQ